MEQDVVGGSIMSARLQTDRLLRVLLTVTMVWGFAVPIIHLACGMSAEQVAPLCEQHEAPSSDAATMVHMDHHEHQPAAQSSSAEQSDDFVECCIVETKGEDHRAPLVSLQEVPAPPATPLEAPVADDSQIRTAPPASESSPPVAFRLLFSVFLI